MPKSNIKYWQKKIERNTLRDAESEATLEQEGWTIIKIWECELKTPDTVVEQIRQLLHND